MITSYEYFSPSRTARLISPLRQNFTLPTVQRSWLATCVETPNTQAVLPRIPTSESIAAKRQTCVLLLGFRL